jgi:hypothetical protein
MTKRKLVAIDLFAGAGGFSTGARMAVHMLGNAVVPAVAKEVIVQIQAVA